MCTGSQLKAGVIAFDEALERKIEDSDGAGVALEKVGKTCEAEETCW